MGDHWLSIYIAGTLVLELVRLARPLVMLNVDPIG